MSKYVEKVQYPSILNISSNFNFKRPDTIPEGVGYNDLTPKQQKIWRDAYRFAGYRPGTYQGITGINGLVP